MNVQVEIKGLDKVDFSLAPYGWIRDPKIEFCGIDDSDMCLESLENFFNAIQPEPFENVIEDHLVGAEKDLQNALELYYATSKEVVYVDTISVTIRPVPKSSRDSSPEEIADFIGRMGGA